MKPTTDAHAESYAQLPYDSNPFPDSHPSRLEAMAYLAGLEPVPLEKCRVLELGCAAGGNLIPMADALPGASFVGIDLAPGQVAAGRELVRRLGMTHVRLEAMSVVDVPADFGEFDYIIAHGLYSWVPAEVQRKTLELCKAHLSPRGVAYVSYNALPGWHLRAGTRDMLLYAVEDLPPERTAPERLATARSYAGMILDAGEDAGTYAAVLRGEVGMVLKAPDGYVAHDHMERFHEAVYVHDFAGRAARQGLMYLGDAKFSKASCIVASRLRERHPELWADAVGFEQAVDFACGRQFRRTLLCHAGQAVDRDFSAARFARCHLTASVFPTTATIDLAENMPVTFKGNDGGTSTVVDSAAKAALGLLAKAHPDAVSFADLWEQVRGVLQLPKYDPKREQLAVSLLSLFVSDSVEAQTGAAPFVTTVSTKPRATALARLQASLGRVIHNRRHRTVRSLTDFDRSVLTILDGTRDAAALQSATGAPDREIRECLRRMAMNAVLVG